LRFMALCPEKRWNKKSPKMSKISNVISITYINVV
jgi:hypothetical protein